IVLTEEEKQTLEVWSRPGRTETRYRQRARIVLMAAQGQSTEQTASVLSTGTARVAKWRVRFARNRLAGLQDDPRPGRAEHLRYPQETTERILNQLNKPPPRGYSSWNGELVAR